MNDITRLNGLKDVAEMRRVTAEFFSGSRVVIPDSSPVEALVNMPTGIHDPEQFEHVYATIRLIHTNTDGSRSSLGYISATLRTLLTCDAVRLVPRVDDCMKGLTGLDESSLHRTIQTIVETVQAYADVLIDAGPEPVSVVQERERSTLKSFLTGAQPHVVADLNVYAAMPVDCYDYDEFKDNWAIVEITRLDGSLVGRIVTRMGHIYKSGIQLYLEGFELNYREMVEIDDYLMESLERFEMLGPTPSITPDGSYKD